MVTATVERREQQSNLDNFWNKTSLKSSEIKFMLYIQIEIMLLLLLRPDAILFLMATYEAGMRMSCANLLQMEN